MNEKPSIIKLLLKYYNNVQDNKDNNNLFTISTNNDYNKTASNTNYGYNLNYRYTTNSLMSYENNNNNNTINHMNKDNNNNTNISIMSDLKQDYLIHFQTNYPYNNLENSFPPKVINIKTCIYLYLVEKKKMNITIDSLLLYKFNHGKFFLLNDEDYFYPILNCKIKINKDETERMVINSITDINKNEKNNISNSTVIYYSINMEKIKILVELYSKSIDHISLNISKTCSLLMLKYILLLKLKEIGINKDITNLINNNDEPINNNLSYNFKSKITINEIEKIKIFGNGIVNNNFNQYISKKQTNRNFNNSSIISEIYDYYINNLNSSIIKEDNSNNIMNDNISIYKDDLNDGILSFIMMEQKNNKCSLGLDFRFTILNSFIPISEEENKEENKNDIIAFKNYIKDDSYLSKNGLNLYFNCLNNRCKYNNKNFILNAGYGNFDIFSLIKYNAYCPSCYKSKQIFLKEKNTNNNINDNNNLDLKYIGMMNSKWIYKGYLIGIKKTIVEGKGITVMKDILYKSKEFDFFNQFIKLKFEIEQFHSKNIYNPIDTKNESSIYSDNYNCINETNKTNKLNLKDIIGDSKLNENGNFNEINNNNNNSKIIKIKKDNYNNQEIYENHKVINNKNEDNKKERNNNLYSNNINNNIINNNIKNNDKKNIQIENENNNKINNINKINNNINNKNNYDYNNLNKIVNNKRNLNANKRNKNSKGIYYGNSRQTIQNNDFNDTNNTNADFNIIIDKTKSNCCEKCFDYQQVSQVCTIY